MSVDRLITDFSCSR